MLRDYLLVILLLSRKSGDATNKSDIFLSLPGLKTYQAAVTACTEARMNLVDDQNHHSELRTFLHQNSIEMVWLRVRKRSLEHWTWVNKKLVDPLSIYDGNNIEAKCGGVSLQDRNLRSMMCSERRNGFVCDVPGTQCPEKHFTQGCITYANNLLVIGCKAENWFEARTYCGRIGGDLATVEIQGKMDAIFNYIIGSKLADKCSWLFVGIRKEDWILKNDGNDTLPNTTFWAKNEPRPAGGDCVQLNSLHMEYLWKTAICSDVAPAVCQKYSYVADENVKLKNEESKRKTTDISLFITGLVLFILACITFLTVIVIYLWTRSKQAATNKTEESNDATQTNQDAVQKQASSYQTEESNEAIQGEQDVTIPLLTKSPEKTSLPKANGSLITVVMFSGGINATEINLNIPPSGVAEEKAKNAARTISEEFSAVLATSVGTSKEELKSHLRIVNLRATDASFKLGNTQTDDFLTYLTENEDSIDVIYFPGIRLPVPHSTLYKLKKLRENCVVLCHAKRFITEIPSSEGISVGIYKSNEDEIRSGIVDILLNEKEERAADANTNLAVSKFTGMIAAILHEAKNKQDPEIYKKMKNTCMMRKYMINIVRPSVEPDVPGYGILQFNEATRKACTQQIEMGYQAILREELQTQEVFRQNLDQSQIVETKHDLVKSLASVKEHKGPPISIVFAASPVSDSIKDIEGIPITSIQTLEPCGEVGDLGDKFLKYTCEILTSSLRGKSTPTQSIVQITSIPIRSNDKESASDWIIYHKAIMKIKQLKPDIVYISSDSRSSPRGLGIKRIIMESKRQSIFITGAKGYEGPVAPPAFPSESVITISRKSGPQGSLVDFISSTDQQQVDPTDDDTMKEAWVAAADTVCAAVAVLLKARELDFEENIRNNLRTTTVMRNLLLHMCSHYPHHEVEDGYGTLQPWTVFKDEKLFKELVTLYGGPDKPQNYWSGKVI